MLRFTSIKCEILILKMVMNKIANKIYISEKDSFNLKGNKDNIYKVSLHKMRATSKKNTIA